MSLEQTKRLITYATIGILLLTFAFYSSTTQYANAVSVVTVTFPSGTTTFDVSYVKEGSDTDTTAYIIGANGGVAYVWKKSGSGVTENTIILNVTLTGSGSARAIEVNTDTNDIFAVTNDKIYRLSSSLGISGQLATGTANIIRSLVYDETQNTMYFCTNDGYGTINTVTLSPTTLYSDPQTNGVLGCAVDETNQFMYLSGNNIGASFTCEAIKISLSTNTEVDCVNGGAGDPVFFSVCFDSSHNEIWVASSSSSRVLNYNSTLDLKATVVTSAIPRQCSISNSDGANRVYFNIESNDNISIIDTEADVLISSHLVCNIGVTAPKMDTKRLFNTTNTYITCPEATNSVLVDNTVSEEQEDDIVGGINCSLPENANILTCRLNTIGQTPLGSATETTQESIFDTLVQVGLLDGTNEDCATNGVGYIMVASALGIEAGLFFVATRGMLRDIPSFVWIIATLVIVGMITAFDCLEPQWFIITLLAVVALGAMKLKGLF